MHARARWSEVVSADAALFAARQRFLAEADVQQELSRALARATDRGPALRMLLSMDVTFVIELMPELVRVASVAHADIGLARQVLDRLPCQWREAYLWDYIEPVLDQGGAEEYRRLAELLRDLDSGHLDTLIRRALQSDDAEVREVATDFGD